VNAEHDPASVVVSLTGVTVTVTVTTIREVLSLSNATLQVIAQQEGHKRKGTRVSSFADEKEAAPRAILH
jgi:hypothetical protein